MGGMIAEALARRKLALVPPSEPALVPPSAGNRGARIHSDHLARLHCCLAGRNPVLFDDTSMLEDTEPRRREVASRTCAWGGPWRVGAAWLALLLWALPLGGGCDRPAPRGPQSGAEAEPATGATGVTTGDAPEISRSVGVEGGILVLWPRVVGPRGSPKPTTDLARQLQSRLVAIAQRVAPGRPIDVRPEPERVCPRSGCAAMSLGVLLAVAGKGCVAVALVSDRGQSPAEPVLRQYCAGLEVAGFSASWRRGFERGSAAS
jgi:hypothetical protein